MKSNILLTALVATTFITVPVVAQEAAPSPVVVGGDTTIVYVFPTTPQTFVPVATLPSFLVMPGAEVPTVATQVIYTKPGPAAPASVDSIVDVDCSNFTGVVKIAGPDTFNLDDDGDRVGCEPEDR